MYACAAHFNSVDLYQSDNSATILGNHFKYHFRRTLVSSHWSEYCGEITKTTTIKRARPILATSITKHLQYPREYQMDRVTVHLQNCCDANNCVAQSNIKPLNFIQQTVAILLDQTDRKVPAPIRIIINCCRSRVRFIAANKSCNPRSFCVFTYILLLFFLSSFWPRSDRVHSMAFHRNCTGATTLNTFRCLLKKKRFNFSLSYFV